jgi:hypothetical protein
MASYHGADRIRWPSPACGGSLPGNTLRVILLRPERAGRPGGAVIPLFPEPGVSAAQRQMGRRGIVFSYIQFSAVADRLTWGNRLCRSSDTWGLKSLGTQAPGFGGCLRARPRHRAGAPLDPRAGNAVTSTWRECRHDHFDTAPLNQLGQGNDAQRPGSSNPAPHRPRHLDRQCD